MQTREYSLEAPEKLLSMWLKERIIQNQSEHTIEAYQRDLTDFFNFCDSKSLALYDIEASDLREYLANRVEKDQLSSSSLQRHLTSIRQFMKWAEQGQYLQQNPSEDFKLKRQPRSLPGMVDIETVHQILDQAPPDKPIEQQLWLRDKAILELLYSSGLRSMELINLSEFMINIEEREIRVIGKGDKERITFFSENAKKWLIKYIEEKKRQYENYTREVLIVNSKGKKLTTRSLRRLISAHAHEAGIQKEITPHVFRHSFATELLNNGVDIRYLQELLGHSSIATTQVYTHVSKAFLRDIYMNTHPLAKE